MPDTSSAHPSSLHTSSPPPGDHPAPALPGTRLTTPRPGERPTTSTEGPHRQLDQKAPPQMWGLLVAKTFALPGVEEFFSQVSPATSRGVFLTGQDAERIPETNLAPGRRLEPVHLHGVEDTSVHLVLPAERGRELADLGWAEPHGYAEFGTEWMVYGPRDEQEVDLVLSVIEESIAFARGE
ncbi:luciferase family protein [Micrococcus lylae]|uniref:luciferase domain-containing protein n=1 Tax=Micrococcus TaxID=1269 RepID=UPI001D0FEAAF|nr:luciferase family protein [Micrococcus sp. FDAARGOS_333]